jgi:photosystem II stability/assembly factor-like uncharacterized protein
MVIVAGVATAAATAPAGAVDHTAKSHPGPMIVGRPAPSGTSSLLAVSCGSSRRCWAVGSGADGGSASSADQHGVVDATTDGGSKWKRQSLPAPTPSLLSAVSCVDGLHCMVVGDQLTTSMTGTVLVTTDGGKRWRAAVAPAGSVDLLAVHCSTARACLTLATDGSTVWSATTLDGGATWTRGGTLPPGFTGASDLSCPGSQSCLVAGYVPSGPGHGAGAVDTTLDGGATWQPATVPAGLGLLHDVACADALTCVAGGTLSTTDTGLAPAKSALLTSTDGGRTFGAPRSPASIDDVFGVACQAARRCVAVGTVWAPTNPPTPAAGTVTSADSGTTWRATRSRFVPLGLDAVDCPTAGRCVAVGGDLVAVLTLPTATANA